MTRRPTRIATNSASIFVAVFMKYDPTNTTTTDITTTPNQASRDTDLVIRDGGLALNDKRRYPRSLLPTPSPSLFVPVRTNQKVFAFPASSLQWILRSRTVNLADRPSSKRSRSISCLEDRYVELKLTCSFHARVENVEVPSTNCWIDGGGRDILNINGYPCPSATA